MIGYYNKLCLVNIKKTKFSKQILLNIPIFLQSKLKGDDC